jgi:Mg-chelatase subunit ChlI
MDPAVDALPPLFPFTAIVGLDTAKRSLLLHAVDPRIGGVLLSGPRGAAKTTLARAFGRFLDALDTTHRPWIEVPLGASIERLTGGTELKSLVESGRWIEQPGLIASANNGALYIDEINLLPDHLADLLLDPASSGRHQTERDGTSRTSNARFILIGSMNPEEGDLRPQLSDRFAHGINVTPPSTTSQRAEASRRRLAFDDDPVAFLSKWTTDESALIESINAARSLLPNVEIPDALHAKNAEIADGLNIESLRAGIAALRTARAIAALSNTQTVTNEHLDEAWTLCSPHRVDPHQTSNTPPPTSQNRPPSSSNHQPPGARPASPPLPPVPQPPPLPSVKKTPSGQTDSALKTASNCCPKPVIAWFESVLHSLASSWHPGNPGFQLRTLSTNQRLTPHVLLDASRSSGTGLFLTRCIAHLYHRVAKGPYARITLHLISAGSIKSFLRMPRKKLLALLLTSASAHGSSAIADGLTKLRMRASRQHASVPLAWVYSDGIASPAPHETPLEAFQHVVRTLRRIRKSAIPIEWFSPAPMRVTPHLHSIASVRGLGLIPLET